MEKESKKERGYVESSAVRTYMLTCGTNLLNTRGFSKAPVFFSCLNFWRNSRKMNLESTGRKGDGQESGLEGETRAENYHVRGQSIIVVFRLSRRI